MLYRLKSFFAMMRLRSAVSRADKAHEQTGNRYYVMPNGNKGKLIIMDRKNFRQLKFKHYIKHDTHVIDLERECFYCTPYKDGRGRLPEKVLDMKKKQYLAFALGK